MSDLVVGDVVDVLDALYPPALAEDWDAVGLAVGSRSQPVTRIAYAVDCTTAVIAEARASAADLLITHHPPFLRGLAAVDLDHPKGRLVADALAAGLSIVVAHTNADVVPFGVVDALADVVGLAERRPLRPRPLATDKIITFVPPDHVEAVIDALAAAGAGHIGAYERCAFTSVGEGTFRAGEGAEPFVGRVGESASVPETRIEMVLVRPRRSAVLRGVAGRPPVRGARVRRAGAGRRARAQGSVSVGSAHCAVRRRSGWPRRAGSPTPCRSRRAGCSSRARPTG